MYSTERFHVALSYSQKFQGILPWLANYSIRIRWWIDFSAESIRDFQLYGRREGEGVIVILRESSAGIRGCEFLKLSATIAAID